MLYVSQLHQRIIPHLVHLSLFLRFLFLTVECKFLCFLHAVELKDPGDLNVFCCKVQLNRCFAKVFFFELRENGQQLSLIFQLEREHLLGLERCLRPTDKLETHLPMCYCVQVCQVELHQAFWLPRWHDCHWGSLLDLAREWERLSQEA